MKERRSEVTKVMQLDYTFERQIELERNEAIEIGMERGLAQGMERGLSQGIQRGLAQGIQQGLERGAQRKMLNLIRKKLQKGRTLEQIADELEETPEAIEPLYQQVRRELNLE